MLSGAGGGVVFVDEGQTADPRVFFSFSGNGETRLPGGED